MSKFFKISLITILCFLIIALSLFFSYLIITKDAKLDESKLTEPYGNVILYDDEGNKIVDASTESKNKNVKFDSLQKYTINAFIASEDRTFFSHNGLNYKRMIKALFKNIAAGSFKEGASTISQQLIKNTHLSNDKTIKRKLNEIKLTKQLEKKYSKKEILEMYFNTIYFGHSCYGLQSASEFYFDKPAEELSLTESATLVGLLTSPNNFSPFKNPEKSLSRRNTVLKAMYECDFINESDYENAVKTPLNAVQKNEANKYSDYISAVFEELENIDLNFYSLTEGCKIKTYFNPKLQNLIEKFNYTTDNSIIISTSEGGVSAYKSTIKGAKRQPGSTIKPLAVYAPAIEEKLLSPYTWILDEKIDYNGYIPENHDKKYHGYVTVSDSIKYSYNVPAVKTLNSLTIPVSEKYLTKMNINLENEEKNLALALGGMKYGLSLKDLCDRYGIFQNKGIYSSSHFIKEISSKEGRIIYREQKNPAQVFSEGTCSLMNEMLIKTAMEGTAKKLSDCGINIAVKTGTCGNENGNTDAYAVGYTSQHRLGIWLGDKNNKRSNISGGKDCTKYLKEILQVIYAEHKPENLDTNSGTSSIQLDAEEYYNNRKSVIVDSASPKLNILEVKTIKGNEPKEISHKFTNPTICSPSIYIKNNAICIELCQTKYYSYLIKRTSNGKTSVIYDALWKKTITDEPKEGEYIYTVTPYYIDSNGNKFYGEEIFLPTVKIYSGTPPQIKIPDITNKDWFDL